MWSEPSQARQQHYVQQARCRQSMTTFTTTDQTSFGSVDARCFDAAISTVFARMPAESFCGPDTKTFLAR